MTIARLIDPTEIPPDTLERASVLVAGCRPVLTGAHPVVQGFALAELVALWLAGHQVAPEQHEELLANHLTTVRELLPLAKEEIDERLRAAGGVS